MPFPETLILGATGRIGRLLRHFWSTPPPLLWQARRPQPGKGWQVFAPLEDPAALASAAAGRQILCLAGSVPGRSGNLADNSRLAAAAIEAAAPGSRVLLASSAAVYGSQAGLLPEDAPLQPANAYGAAKAEMEARAAHAAARRDVGLCVLRIGNVAGLDAALGGWRPGFTLDQFADGRTPARSYIGAQSLAAVLHRLLALPRLPAVLNIAQPGAVQMSGLLTAAGREIALRPAPPSAIAEVELDVSRLASLLPAGALKPADAAQMAAEWAGVRPHLDTAGPEQ